MYLIYDEKKKATVQTSLDKYLYKSDRKDPMSSTSAESEPKMIE
jgi:hypothetical protein